MSCVWHRQPAGHPLVNAYHHLSMFSLSTLILLMFTLLPQHVAKKSWKHWATWGGEAEPRRFDGLCRRSKEEYRARKKFVEKQLNGFEEETNKLADRVTAALVICEEHMSNYHTLLELMSSKTWAKNSRKEIAKSLGRSGCTLEMFWSGNRFTERRWGVGRKEMMKCGIDGRTRMEKRTRKED